MRRFGSLALWVLSPLLLQAQDLREFEKSVAEFSLPNGLRFILVERHDSPVLSFHTLVGAGSVNDPAGATGLTHILEHLAPKGTDTVGSKDWPNEKKELDAIEEAYDKLEAERNKGPRADEAKMSSLQSLVKMAIDRANAYGEPTEYLRALEENGGANLVSSAGVCYTEFSYSLPSNRAELWFLLESQRITRSAFREFYKERDLMLEEYDARIGSNPQALLLQALAATAFAAHPYRNPSLGWPDDIATLRRSAVRAFVDAYYVPANITIAIAGDLALPEAKRLAERYFGPLPAKPMPPLVHTGEPPQTGPRTASVTAPGPLVVAIGYKRPDMFHRDAPALQLLESILGGGRAGLLNKELMERGKIAAGTQVAGAFPAARQTGLFVFLVVPAAGKTADDVQKGLDAMLNRLFSQKLDAAALDRGRAQARALAIRRLSSNAGAAALLAATSAAYGDWRRALTTLDDLDKVTADDIQKAVLRYFTPSGRTVVSLIQPPAAVRTTLPGGVRR